MNVLSNPNSYSKDIVYDLNAYSEEALAMEIYKFSSNIGNAMKTLMRLEFNFGLKTKVAGFLLNVGIRNITWNIMKRAEVPRVCANDPDCVSSKTSSGGFVVFSSKIPLEESIIYYLCVNIPSSQSTEYVYDGQGKHLCSNGFVLDNKAPAIGYVKVDDLQQGFLRNFTELRFMWHGFEDNTKYELLGYESGISKYSSCLGTSPCSDDVKKCKDVGLKHWNMETDLELTPGLTYYVGIKAFDHVGNSACAHSDPFVFDPSPPTKGSVIVGHISKHHHAISGRTVAVYWNGFSDKESGIKSFLFGIGTTPAVDDVLQFYAVGQHSENVLINDHIVEGHTYFILLQVENHAGLKTMASSMPFLIDNSPPFTGTVLEGFIGKPDMDFTSIMNFTCHWNGFEDPQSQIYHYNIGLGTYPYGNDVKSLFNIGLQTEWTWDLPLSQGVRYFTTVEACNSAGLCSRTTSNGITIDETPPVPGVIFAGWDGSHSRFSAHRTSLEFQIDDFYDVHSGLSHFEICIESSNSSCDIVEKRNIRLETSGTLFNLNLPENEELFIVLTALNKAGLSTVKVSDGIRVDSSPPSLIQPPEILNRNKNGYVIDRSFLNLSWRFNDDESQIVKHVVGVKSHHEGHTGIGDILLSGERPLALSLEKKDWLQNGDAYYVTVTACNAAGLCSTANSENFTIDSSKPHFGHMLNATWSNLENKLELNLQNFTDADSSIDKYYIGVGGRYGSSELSQGIIYLLHSGNWNDEQQLHVNIYRNLTLNERVYLSLWSSNKAGLNSSVRHFAFYVSRIQSIHEGNLILEKHSCDAEYCNFDCTCSEFGDKCTELVSSTPACSEINITNTPSSLSVNIGWGSVKKYSLSSQCLYANWNTNSTNVKRFEWSFGLEGRSVGFGVFNVHLEQVWRDVNNNDNVVHCLSNNRSLQHGRLYVAYVKAWWSFTDFTILQSEPILIDLTPPGIRRGKFIIDSSGDCTTDIDYISSNNITSCWQNVFTDQQSGIMTYNIYIGTHPGGDDVTGINNVGMETTKRWINLKLNRNVKYFATVEAVNNLGATTTLTSDGFSIDDKPPLTGVIYASENFRDKFWLTDGDSVDASWEGFTDHGSYIVEYQIALQKNNEKNIIFTPVGLKNKHSFQNIELRENDTFSILVKARDAAGYFSEIVRSKTLFVDITEPFSLVCEAFLSTLSLTTALEKSISTNKILFERGQMYSINIRLKSLPYLVHAKLSLGNMSKNIDFKKTNDQTFHSNYSFISQVDEYQAIHIDMFDLNRSEGNISIEILTCDRTKELHDGGVFASQISPTDILVSSFVVDPESGIADTSINIAQTLNGCPIKSVRVDKNLGTHSVSVFVAHGTTIFASVVAKNYAGKNKTFHANRIIIDHTPPNLQELGSTYTSEERGAWETRLNIHWLASEEESDLQSCQCAFGSISGSENLQGWTPSSLSDCISLALMVPHASYVYPKVRCRNSVGLAREMPFRPVYIVYKAPVSSQSKIQFSVHDVYTKSFNNYQRYNSSIYFNWKEFGMSSLSTGYRFQIKENDAIVYNWTDIGRHTYASVNSLVLKTEKVYTAEVYASNSGNLWSDMINASVLVSDVVPVRTGNSCRLENSSNSDKGFILTWKDVFYVNLDLYPQYMVYIGSEQSYNDVVQGISTGSTNITLTVRETCKELHVVIIAKYATGTETPFMEKLVAPCP
ncbi:uncharacterized protein LOC133175235 [Saccostrea echinata]|uniref:uncharacterized protein LOC133175235 n=1 Tax=Saccostrea echinata TaxID=191078 RepID=UPI002A830A1C|nr:uncharacterized protein LOC133175235 [Saccostrea echinata]